MKTTVMLLLLVTIINALPNQWPIDSVLARGDSCIAIQWIPDSTNTDPTWYIQYGEYCTGSDTVFLHCDFLPGREYRGVPYSYGGEDPWFLFRKRLQNNFLAGNHACQYKKYGDPSNVITGIDCSAFVCFLWNIPRVSTSGLLANPKLTKITKDKLLPGDALVKANPTSGYHAVFVADATDITEAVIWEASSTVFGCRERITNLNQPYWEAFTPLRYPEVNTSIGTQSKKSYDMQFSLTPSPTNQLMVRSFLNVGTTFAMYTIAGKVISKKRLSPQGNLSVISLGEIPHGVYVCAWFINTKPACIKSFIHY